MKIVLAASILLAGGCLGTPVHRCDQHSDCRSGLCIIEAGASDGLCVSGDGDGGVDPTYDPCWQQAPLPQKDACTIAVCEVEPRCCEVEWSQPCIQLAERHCGAHCGQVGAFAGEGELSVTRWSGTDFEPFWEAPGVAALNVTAVGWGDYDGDLQPDLASCDDGMLPGSAIRIWHNDFDTFRLVKTSLFGVGCNEVDWVDLDDDGDLDVVAAGAYEAQVVVNDGGLFADGVRLFEAFVNHVDWVQLGGDTRPDLALAVYGERLTVKQNDGAVLTDIYTSADTQGWDSVSWGDVDGDGDPDLLASGDSVVRVLENTGVDTFTPAATPLFAEIGENTPASMLFDVDGDGDLDLLTLSVFIPMRVFRNDSVGGGTGFTMTPLWTSGTTPFTNPIHGRLAIGDADGDGHTDIVACGEPHYCRMWSGDGLGQFTPSWDPGGSRVIHDVELVGEWDR